MAITGIKDAREKTPQTNFKLHTYRPKKMEAKENVARRLMSEQVSM